VRSIQKGGGVFIIVRVQEWRRKAQKSIFQSWCRIPIRLFSTKNGKETMQLGFITTKLHAILLSVEYSERRGVFIVVAEGRTWQHDASQITSGKSHFSHLNINQNQQFFFDTTIQTTDIPGCPPLSFLRPALWVNMPQRESSWW
jgi:hypothetical protein